MDPAYDMKCFSVDSYCDEPPSSIEGVNKNLEFVQVCEELRVSASMEN